MKTHRIILIFAIALFGGCKREEAIRTYNAPKDPPPGVAVADAGDDEADQETGGKIEWAAPAAWKQVAPPQMATAAYQVSDNPPLLLTISEVKSAKSARATAQMNLNRWEGQLKLTPTPPGDLDKVAHVFKIGNRKSRLVDLKGGQQRMLAGLVPNGENTWAFKLMGPADAVTAQEAGFAKLMESVHFVAEGSSENPGKSGDTPAVSGNVKIPGITSYTLPQGWQMSPGTTSMRRATVIVPAGKDKAEIIVTMFSANSLSDILANVNRWRGNVDLAPTGDAASNPPQEISFPQGPGVIREFSGPEASGNARKRQYVAYTQFPNSELIWFFRFVGPYDAVTASKPQFEAFVKSIKFDEK